MTRKDDDDAGAAIGGGIIGAFVGYGIAKPKIQSLEAQNRELQNENIMLRNTLSAKDNIISQLQEENRKLKEEKKDNNSVKSIAKSLFDKL
jgi:flagellar motor component MotA